MKRPWVWKSAGLNKVRRNVSEATQVAPKDRVKVKVHSMKGPSPSVVFSNYFWKSITVVARTGVMPSVLWGSEGLTNHRV